MYEGFNWRMTYYKGPYPLGVIQAKKARRRFARRFWNAKCHRVSFGRGLPWQSNAKLVTGRSTQRPDRRNSFLGHTRGTISVNGV
jgi:hypothetical protein